MTSLCDFVNDLLLIGIYVNFNFFLFKQCFMNIYVYASFCTYNNISLWYSPRSRIAGLKDVGIKVLVRQLSLTLCNPMDCSLCLRNSPGKNTGMGKPFPSPGDLCNPGIEPGSPTLQAGSLPSKPPRKPPGSTPYMLSNFYKPTNEI